ncbi:MAG TPA: DegV family protein [Candidatus Sulfotelmatobacter sp.]|nr:DegV family protein [Candidatus Sulfotelmatobacter sp.]
MSPPTVAIVTDSTSDLDAARARALGVEVVPLFVNFGDVRYRDRVDLSLDEFYTKLAAEKQLPTTAQPTPAMFEAAFRPHVEAHRPIVCLTIMASLSGTINAATAAARTFPDAEIHIVDSGTVTGGLALETEHAAALARTGASAVDIVAALEHDVRTLRGYATVPDLSHAVRTGRVSRAQAFVGSLVKIVPVLRIDSGAIAEHARVRTFARALDTMVDAVLAEANRADGARVCVVHSHAPAEAQKLVDRLRAGVTTQLEELDLLEAGPVIGTHAGLGAVGIFILPP